jgi:hypothetical protein
VLPAQKLVIVRYADDRDGSYQHNELLKRVLAALAGRVHEADRPATGCGPAGLGLARAPGAGGLPRHLSAYSAKEYCSCRFVMGFDQAYCRGYVQQWLPLGLLEEDSAGRRVSAEGLGRRHEAAWQGARAAAACCRETGRVRLTALCNRISHVQAVPSAALAAAAPVLAAGLPAHANWHLDGESSRLSFVTGKNGDTAEVNRFLVLHGTVDRKGAAEVSIEMDSVSSGIRCVTSACATNCSKSSASPTAR